MTLNVTSWTKHPAWIKLTTTDAIRGEYGKPAPEAPTVSRSQDYDGKLTWKSSNENVVKVNADTGELTVIGAGTAIITISGAETDYRLAPTSISYTVIIDKASPTFSFEEAVVEAVLGETVPENKLSIGQYDGTVQWASSDATIAEVSTDGVVTTKALGEVTITATGSETNNCNEVRSASYTLKVVETAGIKAIDLATPHSLGENGQLTMDNYYDLQGRRIDSNSTRKGVYIVGKKKVVMK